MKISVDTKEDSHDDIRKVIKMLQHLVGDSQEVFTNQPTPESGTETAGSPFANIFGDTSSTSETSTTASETTQETAEETSQSTEDLFAELFSEEELKKMDASNVKNEDDKEDDEVEVKPKDKKYKIEFF
ncbi:hypothetical protein J4448_06550 [Candidatus Woesearchaeota archaeon]|nr:hypothetical protein [Candidatus Woesearchaeota archaeon]